MTKENNNNAYVGKISLSFTLVDVDCFGVVQRLCSRVLSNELGVSAETYGSFYDE